jgi:hypothetical protein
MTGPEIKTEYVETWRHADWPDEVQDRPGWKVHCSECGYLERGYAYARIGSARSVATRHRRRHHGGAS